MVSNALPMRLSNYFKGTIQTGSLSELLWRNGVLARRLGFRYLNLSDHVCLGAREPRIAADCTRDGRCQPPPGIEARHKLRLQPRLSGLFTERADPLSVFADPLSANSGRAAMTMPRLVCVAGATGYLGSRQTKRPGRHARL